MIEPVKLSSERNYKTLLSITIALLVVIIVLAVILLSLLQKPESQDSQLPEPRSDTMPATENQALLFSEPTSSPFVELSPSMVLAPSFIEKTNTPDSFEDLVPTHASPITITSGTNVNLIIENTLKGDFLNVTGGDQNYNYEVGPLAKGSYAVGPNGKFIIYITDDGQVFGMKVGNPHFVKIDNVRKDFSATSKNSAPFFELSFTQTDYAYFLVIFEGTFNQQTVVVLPREITH